MLKRAWIVFSVLWAAAWVLLLVTNYNPYHQTTTEDWILTPLLIGLPVIVAAIAVPVFRYIVYGSVRGKVAARKVDAYWAD